MTTINVGTLPGKATWPKNRDLEAPKNQQTNRDKNKIPTTTYYLKTTGDSELY